MPSSTSPSRALPLLLFLALCVAALVPAPTLAAGRIDRSFGKDGVVDIGAKLAKDHYLGAVAVVPGGPIYFTEQRIGSCRGGCRYEERLRRFGADGAFDGGYSAPAATIAGVREASTSLLVDSRGRVLVAWEDSKGRAFVRRLHPNGSLDRSFGGDGTVEVPCGCSLGTVETTAGDGLVISGSKEAGTYEHYVGISFTIELRADGSPLRSFGRDGVVRLRQPRKSAGSALPQPGGSVLIDGGYCCAETAPEFGWVTRFSPRGHPQPRFGAAVTRSLRRTFGKRQLLWEGSYLLPRAHGTELFGSGFGPADVVALRADGTLDRSFGHDGLAEVRLQSAEAAVDESGRTWVVGARGAFQVRRLTARGRPDTSFGAVGLRGLGSEYGLYLFPDGGDSAIVISPDESICRGECPSDPSMVRVVG